MSKLSRLPEKLSRFAIGGAAIALLGACSAILGLTDPHEDDSIGGEGGSGGDGSSGDSSFEASTCPGGGNTGDSKNCGTCGHDCLGGACNAGACQPVLVVDDAVNLAPYSMVEDDTTLYFSNTRTAGPGTLLSSVSKVSKSSVDGSSPAEQLGEFDDGDGGNFLLIYPFQVALNGTDLYVALNAEAYLGNFYTGGIAKCPGVNCDKNNLFVPNGDGLSVAASPQQVIFGYAYLLDGGLDSEQNDVEADFLLNGTLSKIAAVGSRVNFILFGSAGDVYMASDTGLFKGDTTGGPTRQLTTGEADQIALYNGIVYVTSAPSGLAATVTAVPISGAAPTVVAQGAFLHAPAGIAVDPNFIYVADPGDIGQKADGEVFKCPLTGCGDNGSLRVTLSTGPAAAQNPRTVVAGDTNAIYWGNRYGQIWKLAK